MQVVDDNNKISRATLEKMSEKMFDHLVKAVVDIEKEIMVVDAGMHADQEEWLLENGSQQENLWGINFHPEIQDASWIVFDSMINIRPQQGNCHRGVGNVVIQKKILSIANRLVEK